MDEEARIIETKGEDTKQRETQANGTKVLKKSEEPDEEKSIEEPRGGKSCGSSKPLNKTNNDYSQGENQGIFDLPAREELRGIGKIYGYCGRRGVRLPN